MAKKIVDLKETPPKSIPNLTLQAMAHYVKNYCEKEDKVWYVNLCKSNVVAKKSGEDQTTEGFDISKIRKEFAKKFFPELLKEKKAKTKTQSYMDLLDDILKD